LGILERPDARKDRVVGRGQCCGFSH
jgi:hypothetical protein